MTQNEVSTYPGSRPEWTNVPGAQLHQLPFAAIAQVAAFDAGKKLVRFGTAWRWSGGLVVTAAHVVYEAETATCTFADKTEAFFDGPADIHEEFFTAAGKPRIGSPHDIAVLRWGAANSGGGLDIEENAAPRFVNAIGFRGYQRPMVQHSGRAWNIQAYFGHAAHTERGHSGCPLMSNGSVAGIHLGSISLAADWQPGVAFERPADTNVGLVFSDSIMAFLNSRV